MAIHGLSHLTHKVPGEHFLLVRPVRDDVRRMSVDAPRRSRRVRSRDRRKDIKHVKKAYVKELKRDTHQGRPAKKGTSKKAPETLKIKPMGSKGVIAGRRAATHPVRSQTKKTGLQSHRPRITNPHPPYAYHALPIMRLGSLVRDRGLM